RGEVIEPLDRARRVHRAELRLDAVEEDKESRELARLRRFSLPNEDRARVLARAGAADRSTSACAAGIASPSARPSFSCSASRAANSSSRPSPPATMRLTVSFAFSITLARGAMDCSLRSCGLSAVLLQEAIDRGLYRRRRDAQAAPRDRRQSQLAAEHAQARRGLQGELDRGMHAASAQT